LGLSLLSSAYYGYPSIRKWNEDRKIKISEQREFAARSCNAAEIKRLEPLIEKVKNSITRTDSIQDVLEKIKALTAENVERKISEENIKLQVVTFFVRPKCATAFEYSIEIFFDESEKIFEFKTWAINPPIGYQNQSEKTNETEVMWTYTIVEKLTSKYLADPYPATDTSSLPEPKDPCALGISSKERLERLKQFGAVRDTGNGEYYAGRHTVRISPYTHSLEFCQ
jgi:hypothetical protein